MKPLLYFLHGWGYDSAYWEDFVVPDAEIVRGERGYFGAKPVPYPQRPFIGIGHSLGFLQMIVDRPASMVAVIGLNGFAKFSQAADHPHGVPLSVLTRMKTRLRQEPEKLLADFWAKNGIDGPKGPINLVRLFEAVDFLIENDARALFQPSDCKNILMLSSRNDQIIQVQDGDFPAGVVVWHETSDHHLVHRDAEFCRDHISRFLGQHES